jgi:hypothetical protein
MSGQKLDACARERQTATTHWRAGDRGDIARAERSALAPPAELLQDLLDRTIFRMAGLSDQETNAPKDRLK